METQVDVLEAQKTGLQLLIAELAVENQNLRLEIARISLNISKPSAPSG
jgi:regulator of replication initiation timing